MKPVLIVTVLISCLLGLCSCNNKGNHIAPKFNSPELIVGGFRFGLEEEEIYKIAKSMNYEIVANDPYNIYLKGKIPAMGLTWDKMHIMHNDVEGIKQITLTTEYDKLTTEMIENHFKVLKDRFPNAKATPYIVSMGTGERQMLEDYANLYDINDEDENGYSGNTYYILSQNNFSTNICLKVSSQ